MIGMCMAQQKQLSPRRLIKFKRFRWRRGRPRDKPLRPMRCWWSDKRVYSNEGKFQDMAV